MKTQVIVLNGSSSSGKTTIARCLKAILPTAWISLSIDDLLRALPPSLMDSDAGIAFGEHGEITIGEGFREVTSGWLAGLAAMARGGTRIIYDDVSPELNRKNSCGHSLPIYLCCGSACTATPRSLPAARSPAETAWWEELPHSRPRSMKRLPMTSKSTQPRQSRWSALAPSLRRCLKAARVRVPTFTGMVTIFGGLGLTQDEGRILAKSQR